MPASRRALLGLAGFALVSCRPAAAGAQAFEVLGTRALGMGGAFVAVADDASSVYWNPAGQVGGSLAAAGFETGSVESGPDDDAREEGGASPASRVSSWLVAVTTPPVGFGYYRLEMVSSDGTPGASPGFANTRRIVTNQVATTVGQTIGPYVALGMAAKAVSGGVAFGTAAAGTDPLEAADDLDVDSSTHFDVDVGAILSFRRLRLAIVGRNLLAPELDGPAGERFVLERQARFGLAVLPWDRIVLALDADLMSSNTVSGDRRNVAVGAEGWWLKRRLGVRGGFRASTIGDARPVGAVGASVGVWSGLFVEAQATRGEDEGDRGWSVGLSARYGF